MKGRWFIGWQRYRKCRTLCDTALLVLVLIYCAGCESKSSNSPATATPPAKVDRSQIEESVNRIQLTATAEERLGLKVAKLQTRPVQNRRLVGGEAILPPDASVTLYAPFAARLSAPPDAPVPAAGKRVAKGQAVLVLVPALSPERNVLTPAEQTSLAQANMQLFQARIDADGQVEQARAQLDAAEIALQRSRDLLRDQAGTVMAVDSASAQHQLAQKTLEAALERKKLVDSIKLNAEAGTVETIRINAPISGVLRNMFVAPEEIVPAGTPLFDISDLSILWIRVPVYAGDANRFSRESPALIQPLSMPADATPQIAHPVPAPPTAVPQTSAIDFYYQMDNAGGQLLPGEKVLVELPLGPEEERPVIPRSAIVFDIYGGTWVYERVSPQTFVRRRVSIPFFVEDGGVMERGPAVGAELVVSGANELFGTEFEFGK